MRAVGLIAEYNPFHNGHLYHLKTAKKLTNADAVVVAMSGNFTQRGEPAIVDKWQRTRMALANGADLVCEIPLINVVEPANGFASGALHILNALKVDRVVFGAEHPKWDYRKMVQTEQNFNLAEFKKFDQTYATQFNNQLKELTGVSLRSPNDILAFAYFKAQMQNNYQFDLVPIQRTGSNYDDNQITGKLASAKAIRTAIRSGNYTDIERAVPPITANILKGLTNVPSWSELYPLLRNQLIQAKSNYLADCYQMAEGLENRLKQCAENNLSFDDFIYQAKTKRYTYAHLLRLFVYILLQVSKEEATWRINHPYIRLLGFTDRGRQYLHEVKKNLDLPLIVKVDQRLNRGKMGLDYRAGKLYQTFTPDEQDLTRSPIMDLSRNNH